MASDNIDYVFAYDESLITIESSPTNNTDYGKAYNTLGLVTGKDVPVTITSSDSMVAPIEIAITVGFSVKIYDTSGNSILENYNVNAGSSLTLPNLSSGGYGTIIGQTSASYVNGQSITVNSNITLYCLDPYTIRIYDGSTLKASYTVVRGRTQILPSISICGYGTNSSSTSASYSNGQTITVTSNLDLYCLSTMSAYIYTDKISNTRQIQLDQNKTFTLKYNFTDGTNRQPEYYLVYFNGGYEKVMYNSSTTFTVSDDTKSITIYAYYHISLPHTKYDISHISGSNGTSSWEYYGKSSFRWDGYYSTHYSEFESGKTSVRLSLSKDPSFPLDYCSGEKGRGVTTHRIIQLLGYSFTPGSTSIDTTYNGGSYSWEGWYGNSYDLYGVYEVLDYTTGETQILNWTDLPPVE